VHLQLGMLYQNHLQKPDLARTHYLQSLALNPRSGLCHYNLGVLLTTHYHEHVAARDHLLQAQSFGYFWSHFKLARLLEHQLCDYDRAEHHYKEALLDGRPQSKLFYARFLRKHRPLETELQQQNYCKACHDYHVSFAAQCVVI
jgi:tetratricopeptide (TPR) repeat protein